MYNRLPEPLVSKIYDYDPTYRLEYDKVMQQFEHLLILYFELRLTYVFNAGMSDRAFQRELRKFALRHKKKDLKGLMKLMFIKPRTRKLTKMRMVQKMITSFF